MQKERQPPPWWADLLVMTAAVAGNLLLVWSQLPPQEKDNLRLTARQFARRMASSLAVRARQAGHAGMAEEIAGRDPSAQYLAAAWLGRWRDRLEKS